MDLPKKWQQDEKALNCALLCCSFRQNPSWDSTLSISFEVGRHHNHQLQMRSFSWKSHKFQLDMVQNNIKHPKKSRTPVGACDILHQLIDGVSHYVSSTGWKRLGMGHQGRFLRSNPAGEFGEHPSHLASYTAYIFKILQTNGRFWVGSGVGYGPVPGTIHITAIPGMEFSTWKV